MLWVVEGKQRVEWDRSLLIAQTIINSAPSFGKKKRRPPNLFNLNPYRKRRASRGVPLRGEMGAKMLDAMVKRSENSNGRQGKLKGDQGG